MNNLSRRLIMGGALALLVGFILELRDRGSVRSSRLTAGGSAVQRSIGTLERLRDTLGDALAESATRVKETDVAGPATAGADAVLERVGQIRETASRQGGAVTTEAKDQIAKTATAVKREAAVTKRTSKRAVAGTTASAKKASAATKKKAVATTANAKKRAARSTTEAKKRAGRTADSAKGMISPENS
jgi:ParB-like chromosome segregation protein Spo0J